MNTSKSYNLAKIELVMLAIIIGFSVVASIFHITNASSIIVLPMLIAIILSLVGSYYGLKSLPEPNNKKKIIALIVNFSFTSLLILLIITNILDIIKLFSK